MLQAAAVTVARAVSMLLWKTRVLRQVACWPRQLLVLLQTRLPWPDELLVFLRLSRGVQFRRVGKVERAGADDVGRGAASPEKTLALDY